MSDLVGNPLDRFYRVMAHSFLSEEEEEWQRNRFREKIFNTDHGRGLLNDMRKHGPTYFN